MTQSHAALTRAHELAKQHHANRKTQQKMVQFLGSENGTDFGPDPRTQTVHLHPFVNVAALQVLDLYLRVCKCMRASTRASTRARAPACRHLCQRGRVCTCSSGRAPTAPTNARCLRVVLASPRHARARTERNRNWCDRN